MHDRHVAPWVTALIALLGVICLVIGVIYLVEPAKSLPAFLPGHQAGLARHHDKHGIAALILAVVLFAAAWVSSGSKAPATS